MQKVFFLGILFILTFLIYRNSFSTFFAQDDFILIQQFSQNNLAVDLEKAVGKPEVTHWRPLHNFYFLISGNLFAKNFYLYHFFTFLIHVLSAFVIYTVGLKIFKSAFISSIAAFLYAVNPLHFVSLFWISGGATSIGFLFFITSFYFFIQKNYQLYLFLFFLSLLGSEAMIIGAPIFLAWSFLNKRLKDDQKLLMIMVFISLTFLIVRFLFLTPIDTFSSYQLSISTGVLNAFRYYLVQIVGLGENRDFLGAILFLIFLFCITFFSFKKITRKDALRILTFFSVVISFGLFPFVFLSEHLSGNYMNISCFGFSMLAAWSFTKEKKLIAVLMCVVFFIVSFKIVSIAEKNSWVVEKSKISRYYLEKMTLENPPHGSIIKFTEDGKYSSYDAYIALGTGKAITFWFPDKHYLPCFSFYEKCE